MAASTIAWRSFENTTDVARLASGIGMRPLQRKTAFDVIKVAR